MGIFWSVLFVFILCAISYEVGRANEAKANNSELEFFHKYLKDSSKDDKSANNK